MSMWKSCTFLVLLSTVCGWQAHCMPEVTAKPHEVQEATVPTKENVHIRKLSTGNTHQKPDLSPVQYLEILESGDNFITMQNGYVMVFRVQAGIDRSAYETFTAIGMNDDDRLAFKYLPCDCQSTGGHCNRHFRSRILDLWEKLPIERVRVGLYKDNKEQGFFEFDGRDTTYTNWFSKQRLLLSSYEDLEQGDESVSIEGLDGSGWLFSIGLTGEDDKQKGWLDVTDSQSTSHTEQVPNTFPKLSYSNITSAIDWSQDASVGDADVLVISVRLDDSKLTFPCFD